MRVKSGGLLEALMRPPSPRSVPLRQLLRHEKLQIAGEVAEAIARRGAANRAGPPKLIVFYFRMKLIERKVTDWNWK